MKNKILILTPALFLIIILSIYLAFNNINMLFILAESFDKPSKGYYFLIEKIYKIADKEDISKIITKNLENDHNKHLHDLYAQTIGIVGMKNGSAPLIKLYAKYQTNKKRKSIIYNIINSIGVMGDEKATPLLVRLLENFDKHDILVTKYTLGRSLYLLTGEAGDMLVTDELKLARNVIQNSKGRTRTFKEMLILDNLFRPPEWKKKPSGSVDE